MSGSRRGVSRAAAWYARWGDLLTARRVLLLAGAGVLAASGVFGGLREVEAEPDRTLRVGEPLDAAPFELTVTRARTISEVPGRDRRGSYVLVDVTLRNTDSEVVYGVISVDALRITGRTPAFARDSGDELAPIEEVEPDIRVRADATQINPVPPGLTFETVFIWEVPGDLPDEVELVARARTKRESRIDDQVLWFDPRVVGRLTLPVEPEAPPAADADQDGGASS